MKALRCLVLACVLAPVPASVAAAQARDIDFAALRDETVKVMSEYLRINTTNPPGNELRSARFLQAFLAREGIEGQILDTVELGAGRANFYARLKGNGSAKALALVQHMDVVPANRELWSVDPFSGAVQGGEVWGRGALDMKGQGIIHLMTMVALKRAGVHLTRDLVLIANADEEVEGSGAAVFVKRHPELIRDVEFLITEGGHSLVEKGKLRYYGLSVGEKRAYWMKITAKGTPSHGSQPTKDNPVPKIARAVARLAAWETPVRVLPAVDQFFKAAARAERGEHRAWLSDVRAGLRSPRSRAWILGDPYRNAILRNTVTPTVLRGAKATNIIPPSAEAEIDVRLLPDVDTARFTREMTRVIGDPDVTLEALPGVQPSYSAPLGTAVTRAAAQVLARLRPGIPIATPLDAGATDRPTYAQTGILAYGIEPFLVESADELKQVHGNDERISIANIEFGLTLFVGLVRAMQ
ncbi:MAG: M20/M25/M40 family metallo-hydrolase [Gemmatimonadota bacterium]|nr:M20/M25/M40 family metallo-hydrolase [Gemmatimonadota bacterium]